MGNIAQLADFGPLIKKVVGIGLLVIVAGANAWWFFDDTMLYLEVLIGGLLSGVLYSLVALGFVLIFKASGVFNFAQGAMALFAALTFVLLIELADTADFWDWTGWLSLVLAVAALVFFYTTRYTRVFKTQKDANRALIWMVIAGIVAMAIVFAGDTNMWRAIFVAGMLFLALAVGVNFSHGAAAILLGVAAASLLPGALDFGSSSGGLNFWRSLVITLVVMMTLAIAIERIVLRPLINQEQIILFMATIGLNFFIEGVSQGVWDSLVHPLDLSFCLSGSGAGCIFAAVGEDLIIEDMPFELAGMFISKFDIFATIIAAILVAVLAVFFQRTRIGRALRAVADDHQTALSVGISLRQIWGIVWGVAGLVALVAGLIWGSKLGVQFSLSLVALKALPVLILGGFTSVPGAIIGGLIVGATEKLFEFYVGLDPFYHLGGATENWTPYMLAMVILLFRPQGLFGDKIIERV